jgi:hypothetical protein
MLPLGQSKFRTGFFPVTVAWLPVTFRPLSSWLLARRSGPMNWVPLFLAIAFVVGIGVASFLWWRYSREQQPAPQTAGSYPFERSPVLMTETEHAFLKVLTREMASEFYVFPKVRLADLVTVPKKVERRLFYLNLVRGKQVDFLLCELNHASPALAILLGDSSADRARGEDTQLIEQILQAAQVPLLRVPLSHCSGPELKAMVRRALRDCGASSTVAGRH